MVREVRSKYLDLHLRIIDQFELRFPGVPGISRVRTCDNDVKPLLDVVRRVAEANQVVADTYLEGKAPLGFVARALGGDPVSFAAYIRSIGGEIRTCVGLAEERDAALRLALNGRGRGAVLDFTAYTAAEMKILPHLRSWFGELKVPDAALSMIDGLIERQRDAIGKQSMTVAWIEEQFYRDEHSDEFRQSQMEVLQRERSAIEESCSVERVILPNQISELSSTAIAYGGPRYLDAAYLSQNTKLLLLAEDQQYRELAAEGVGCQGSLASSCSYGNGRRKGDYA